VRVVAVRTGTFYGRKMRAGYIYTVAGTIEPGFLRQPVYSGDGGPALKAVFATIAVTVDGAGNVVLTSDSGRILVVAEKTGTFYGKKMRAGHIYTIAGNGAPDHSGDGGPATRAELNPVGVVFGRVDGLTVIPDISGGAAFTTTVRAVASRSGTFFGQKMTAGDIYTIAGQGVGGFSGDGGPALHALLTNAAGIAFDAAGNLVFTDIGNLRVRVIAEKTGTFYGQAVTTGDIYTVAGDGNRGFSGDGGPATSAEFESPGGLAIDGTGNLVIADVNNNRVRVVAASTGTFYGVAMTARDIYTVAGDNGQGFSGDGGPATHASLFFPAGVAVTGTGNLVIADFNNNRIRQVTG
jgi:trimeric autotransporter adhesin